MSVVTVTADSVRRSQLDSARPNEPSLGTHEDSSPLAPRLSAGGDTDTRIAGIPRMRVRSGRLCATARGKRCARTETAAMSNSVSPTTSAGVARSFDGCVSQTYGSAAQAGREQLSEFLVGSIEADPAHLLLARSRIRFLRISFCSMVSVFSFCRAALLALALDVFIAGRRAKVRVLYGRCRFRLLRLDSGCVRAQQVFNVGVAGVARDAPFPASTQRGVGRGSRPTRRSN